MVVVFINLNSMRTKGVETSLTTVPLTHDWNKSTSFCLLYKAPWWIHFQTSQWGCKSINLVSSFKCATNITDDCRAVGTSCVFILRTFCLGNVSRDRKSQRQLLLESDNTQEPLWHLLRHENTGWGSYIFCSKESCALRLISVIQCCNYSHVQTSTVQTEA